MGTEHGAAARLLASLPASPSVHELQQLQQLFLGAFQADCASAGLHGAAGAPPAPPAGPCTPAIKALAKAHGPLALALIKGLPPRLGPATDPQQSRALCLLTAHALDVLDVLRGALATRGLELEAQRYSHVRRMSLAGHADLALQQGARLHAALQAHVASSPTPTQELQELCLACRLNLVVSLGEALPGMEGARARVDALQQVAPAAEALVQQLGRCAGQARAGLVPGPGIVAILHGPCVVRAPGLTPPASANMRPSRAPASEGPATKHAESVFKYLYKVRAPTCLCCWHALPWGNGAGQPATAGMLLPRGRHTQACHVPHACPRSSKRCWRATAAAPRTSCRAGCSARSVMQPSWCSRRASCPRLVPPARLVLAVDWWREAAGCC